MFKGATFTWVSPLIAVTAVSTAATMIFFIILLWGSAFVYQVQPAGRLLIIVEPLATLASKPACVYIFFKQRAWTVFWIAQAIMHNVQNGQAYVQTYKI